MRPLSRLSARTMSSSPARATIWASPFRVTLEARQQRSQQISIRAIGSYNQTHCPSVVGDIDHRSNRLHDGGSWALHRAYCVGRGRENAGLDTASNADVLLSRKLTGFDYNVLVKGQGTERTRTSPLIERSESSRLGAVQLHTRPTPARPLKTNPPRVHALLPKFVHLRIGGIRRQPCRALHAPRRISEHPRVRQQPLSAHMGERDRL